MKILLDTLIISFFSAILGGSFPIVRRDQLKDYLWMHKVDSFCDGMFIAIACTHLLPEIFYASENIATLSLYIGMISGIVFYIARFQKTSSTPSHSRYLLTVLLFAHCLFEGIAVSSAPTESMQISLSIAILAHKTIEAFVFFNLIARQKFSTFTLLALLLLFSLLTPIGILVGKNLVHAPSILENSVNALTAGAFLAIGTTGCLLQSCSDHTHSKNLWLVLGFAAFASISYLI